MMMFSSFQFSPRRILESYFPNGPLFFATSDITGLTCPDFDCTIVNHTSLQSKKTWATQFNQSCVSSYCVTLPSQKAADQRTCSVVLWRCGMCNFTKEIQT